MSKGSRRERELHDIYKQAGYIPYRPATVQFGENDVWGLFDVLAMHPGTGELHAVQCKCNRAQGIEEWTRNTRPFRDACRTLYAVPYDREGWRLIEAIDTRDGDAGSLHVDLLDERELDCGMGAGLEEYLRS